MSTRIKEIYLKPLKVLRKFKARSQNDLADCATRSRIAFTKYDIWKADNDSKESFASFLSSFETKGSSSFINDWHIDSFLNELDNHPIIIFQISR
ncbi:MAG: hypothetical protein H0T84_03170 [Tatlockia sp.]|nr:hypothetical protein [Tatlockia sp.]